MSGSVIIERPGVDRHYLDMARLVSQRGTCFRRHVGCVLVNERGHVLSTGYNGRAAGLDHCNEPTRTAYVTAPERDRKINQLTDAGIIAVAEEYNPTIDEDPDPAVIAYLSACKGAGAASGGWLDGCEAIHAEQNALLQCRDVYQIQTCYVTVSLLMNTSCKRIVFAQPYAHDEEARALWTDERLIGDAANRDRKWILKKP